VLVIYDEGVSVAALPIQWRCGDVRVAGFEIGVREGDDFRIGGRP
jgi:hypothetical protein